jgi:hypothetical protein
LFFLRSKKRFRTPENAIAFFAKINLQKPCFKGLFVFPKGASLSPLKNATQGEQHVLFTKSEIVRTSAFQKSFLREAWEKMTKTFFHYILR